MRKILLIICWLVLSHQTAFARTAGELIWVYQGPNDHCVCVMGFSDVNADQHPDVVGIWGNSAYQGDHNLYCLSGPGINGNPQVIWSVGPQGGVSSGGGYGDQCLSYYTDNDNDGINEILLGTAWGGRCAFLINGSDGATEWAYDTYINAPSGWCYSVEMIGDLNYDGIPDVLAGFGSEHDAAVALSGQDGSVLWKFQANDAVFAVTSISSINYDPAPEAIIGTGDLMDDRVVCIDGASNGIGTVLWQFHAGESIWDVAGFVDIDSDGFQDVLAGSWSNYVYCLSGINGNLIWQSSVGDNVMAVEVGDDQNGDGVPEVLVASWNNLIISLDGLTGVTNWTTLVGSLNGGDVWTIHGVQDVNNDGIDEVVAGSFDQNVYLCSGIDGAIMWQYNTGNRLKSVRPAGDLDGDGKCDIIAGTQFLYSGGGGKMFAISGGTALALDINMIPDNSPVQVPAGGSFGYTGILINGTNQPQSADVWVMVNVPGYGIFGPIQQLNNVTLAALDTLTVHASQAVPGYAPIGPYFYIAYCGDYPSTKNDSAFFQFTVTAGFAGDDACAEWHSEGWNEPIANANFSIINGPQHPLEFDLFGSYPNPFNASTNINFSLEYGGKVDLTIYNVMGQKVAHLVDGYLPEGSHSVNWEAAEAPSGIYYAKLNHFGETMTTMITLVK